jgi:arginyl-tRNA synthetase
MILEHQIKKSVLRIVKELYLADLIDEIAQIQKTRKEFEGDFTLVVFPFVRYSKKSPDITAQEIGEKLLEYLPIIHSYNVIKGFLNISLHQNVWFDYVKTFPEKENHLPKVSDQSPIVVEFSSPNTNKPLHLGHVRNILLGNAICNILEANGHQVVRVNLVNDRGIHICKSMVAWEKSAEGETPQSSNMKGDKFVGKYYVEFDRLYKNEIKTLESTGITKENAEKQAPILLTAQQMLRKWEEGDEHVRSLWKTMNRWVYQGFDATYQTMGITFDKIYYESNTYLSGKKIIEDGLQKHIFYKHEDGSIRIDLTNDGLDEKVLLRADGTSVYITQDIGTACLRANEYRPKQMIYIVGNEQNYHFDVLKLILDKKLGFDWGKTIFHLSYGMVELPSGKMKSREGTVVDADDLMNDMVSIAKENTEKLGKSENFTSQQQEELYAMIGIGALKYFILKVDPKKNMLFNPEESIDLNGNTAPFIQYTHARIRSLLRKAEQQSISLDTPVEEMEMLAAEKDLIRVIYEYDAVLSLAGKELSPALIANYTYELVKTYNHFYQDTPIFREEDTNKRTFRLQLSAATASIIKRSMGLLGIDVPEQM